MCDPSRLGRTTRPEGSSGVPVGLRDSSAAVILRETQKIGGAMEILSVIAAAVAGFGIGAVWYLVLSKPWVADSGVPVDAQGRATGATIGRSGAVAYGGGFLCVLVVAGMMRHMLASSGIVTPWAGLVSGLGVGLFFIAPWITLNVLFAMRPMRLALIDGGYATLACAAMGLVLTLI